MFFLYLAIFIIIVSTPFIITEGRWIFSEDESEAVVLLVAGIVSFMIYRLRDYQVFEHLKDRMRLQRLFARAQKDLSDSYSYIGQANRRTDIMYDIFSDLSHMHGESCELSVAHAMDMLPYTDKYSFRFLNIKNKKSRNKIDRSDEYSRLPDELFFKSNNARSYRHRDTLFVYSETDEKNIRVCVALPYSENAENDIDFFKALTAYYTMVYVFNEHSCVKKSSNV